MANIMKKLITTLFIEYFMIFCFKSTKAAIPTSKVVKV